MARRKFTRVAGFLKAIRLTPSISIAAKAAGIHRSTHYRRLERDEEYRAAFEKAMIAGVDAFEDAVIRRAQFGVRRLVLYHGKPVMIPADWSKPKGKKVPLFEDEFPEGASVAILKARKPDVYRDRVSTEVTGKDGAPLTTELRVVFVGSDGN